MADASLTPTILSLRQCLRFRASPQRTATCGTPGAGGGQDLAQFVMAIRWTNITPYRVALVLHSVDNVGFLRPKLGRLAPHQHRHAGVLLSVKALTSWPGKYASDDKRK